MRTLTSEELGSVAQVLGVRADQAQIERELETWLQRWRWFVEAVEAGYDDIDAEYFNDLSSREQLEGVCDALRPDTRKQFMTRLNPLDARFRDATRQATQPIWGTTAEAGWWDWRIPKILIGELKDDFHARGIR